MNTAAVVQQSLQPLQGGVLPFGAAAQAIARAAASRNSPEGEAIEPFAADQAVFLADHVFLDAEIPAHMVKDQLQRPHPPFT